MRNKLLVLPALIVSALLLQLAISTASFARSRRDPPKKDAKEEAAERKANEQEAQRIAKALSGAIVSRPSKLSGALSRYNRIEGTRDLDEYARYILHKTLLDTISKLDDDSLAGNILRGLRKNPRTHLPSIVLLMKVLVHGKHGMPRAERVKQLVKKARGKHFRLSVWGMRLLGDSRWPESVDALIEIMDREERARKSGSMTWHLVSAEIYRVLGAEAAQGTAASISLRWKKMGRKIPKKPDYSPKAKSGGGAGATVVFFGVRISPRSIFCIDTSSSMRQPASISTGSGRTMTKKSEKAKKSKSEPKIDIVKRELERALGSLMSFFQFNVISYNAGYAAWKGGKGRIKLVSANDGNMEAARKYARKLGTDTGTNIHDSVRAALKVSDVDTIYLLSDGQPSRGGGIPEIEKTVRALNYLRGIRIVTYGIVPESGKGFDENFMKRLAKNNWGWYRRLNDG